MLHNTIHLLPSMQTVKQDSPKQEVQKRTPGMTKLPASPQVASYPWGWSFLCLTDSYFPSATCQEWKCLLFRQH